MFARRIGNKPGTADRRRVALRDYDWPLAALSLLLCGDHAGQSAQTDLAPQAPTSTSADSVEIQINFRLARDVVLEVRTLRGELERTNPANPVTFDDSESFIVKIDTAQVAIGPASLTGLMNSYVLANTDSPVKNVAVTIDGDRLVQK